MQNFISQVGYNIAPKIDTPLSEMLALGLERYVDELTEISSQASKEYALEKVKEQFLSSIISTNHHRHHQSSSALSSLSSSLL